MKTVAGILAGLLGAVLALIVYSHAFSDGLCCADDTTNAIVAKNLAFGRGYANSISLDGRPGLTLFDPRISTGPALNLPAAGLVAIFGNRPWVPGFATATITFLLLAGIGLVVAHTTGAAEATAYVVALMLGLYSATAGNFFEHWYALIGELPSALLCVVGAAILASGPPSRFRICWSSFAFGLAMMTKLIALLSAMPLAVWLVVRVFRGSSDRRRRVGDAVAATLAFLIPCLAFQAWKLSVLGGTAYLANVGEFWWFFQTSDASAAAPAGIGSLWATLGARSVEHAMVIRKFFGYHPLVLAAGVAAVAVTVRIAAGEPRLRLMFALLAGAALTHGLWWLLLSNGRPRYILVGLFLYFAALACAVFARSSLVTVAVVTTALLVLVASGYPRTIQPAKFALRHGFSYTPRVANLVKTAEFLDARSSERPFVMGWWATAGDVEFAMSSVGNFVQDDRVDPARLHGSALLVRNRRWVEWASTPAFTAWEQRCDELLLDAPPYRVSRCPPVSE